MMTAPDNCLVVLAAGGTGGHVFPAEALASELMDRGCRLALITDKRGKAYGGTLGALDTHYVAAGGIAGKGLLAKVRSVAELAVGTWQARSLVNRLNPSAVVGFGGYASVPTMMAATFAGVPSAVHEQNAVLGRANRLLASRVKRIATSFTQTRGVPESAVSKVIHTGMPVRSAILDVRETVYPTLGGDAPIHLLILGGSQGATVLSDVVPEAVSRLPADQRSKVRVTQQCRAEDIERVRALYAANGIEAELASFFDDVPSLLASAHLVIARSGASTVGEVTAVGRPSILVPYPHAADDHQTANAHALDEAGAGWLISQEAFTSEYLAERMASLLGLPAILRNAAENARAAGRPQAAAQLADLVIDMLNGNGTNNGSKDGERKVA